MHRHLRVFGSERHRLEVAGDDLAEIHERQPPVFVDHGVDRQHPPEHAHDLQLFLVQRVALKDAIVGLRVGHEARAVERGDRVPVRNPRGDDTSPEKP
jgi:hypothetical protein